MGNSLAVVARKRLLTARNLQLLELARPEGLEPPAYWFEASRSIRLSYGRVDPSYHCNMAIGARYVETEIKLRCPGGAGEARRMIERHGYALFAPRTLESDQLF